MESVNEVLIVSDAGSNDANCSMYDLQSGSLIESYKEGHSVRNGLDFIGKDFIISAFKDEPIIKTWQIGQANSVAFKVTSAGQVSALAISKCGRYSIAGIGIATYVWEIASGSLAFILKYHVNTITSVEFSSDSSHFITAAKDGMVFVYLLNDALDSAIDNPKARYTWADHVAEVTDLYVGCVGYYSRVATASLDTTCRIYELDTGCLHCIVHIGVPVCSVTMDTCEYFLFLGAVHGDIYKINLFSMMQREMHVDADEKKNVFIGHSKEINTLCVSYSGNYLISGSTDGLCKIFEISSLNCIRTQPFTGPVTNVLCTLLPPGLKNRYYSPRIDVSQFKSSSCSSDAQTKISSQELSLFHAGAPEQFFDSRVLNYSTDNLERNLKRDNLMVDNLSQINQDMYNFALRDIFNIDNPNNEDILKN